MKSIVRYGILVFLCAISTHTLTAQLSGLYDYSADITVNESMIPGVTDLTNFVLLISLESNTEMRDTGNGGRIKSNGVDIVFAPNSSSVVGDIYKFDLESYSNTTGELVVWVQVDLSASSNTTFTMFYGRAAATDYNNTSLWVDAGYVGVWQLSETPGANAIVDATGNSANGSSFGNVAIDASSIVGQGYSFDGTGDYILIPENASIEPTGSFTISAWFKTAGVQNPYAKIFAKGETAAPYASYTLEMRPNGTDDDHEVGFQTGRQNGNFVLTDSNGNGKDDIATGNWNYFAGTFDVQAGPSITQTLYLNGGPISTSTAQATSLINYYVGTYDLAIGGIYNVGINNEFQGTIDELRIASGVRSENYLRTEVRNTACVGNYMTITGITGLTCTDAGLPVQFVDFSATKSGNNIYLEWSTASEENNDFFTVERSFDGIVFEALAEIDGAGNSNQILNYSFTDYGALPNLVYYRLKQTDFDGKFEYSREEKVIGSSFGNRTISIYPNPTETNGSFNITYANSVGLVKMTLYSLTGQLKYKSTSGANSNGYFSHKIETTAFEPGVYIVKIVDEVSSFNGQIVIN